jgi:ligand-binding SRPBCC domain-containing protein
MEMARNFTFQKSLRLSVPVEDLRALHHSAEAIPQLTPPFVQIRVEGDPAIRDGNLQTIKSRVWPTPWQTWKARISEVGPNGFTDTAEQSPFQFFRHRHSFIAHGEGCELIDAIEFRAPGGWLGNQVARLMLTLLFAYRHVVTKRSLTRARS